MQGLLFLRKSPTTLQIKIVRARCAAEPAVQVCDIYVVQTCTDIIQWRCVPLYQKRFSFPAVFLQLQVTLTPDPRPQIISVSHGCSCRQIEMDNVNGFI